MDGLDLLIVEALLFHLWQPGEEVWPSLDRIAFLSGLSKSTVCTRLGKLEKLRLLKSRQEGQATYRSLDGLVRRLRGLKPRDPPVQELDTQLSSSRTPTCPGAGHKVDVGSRRRKETRSLRSLNEVELAEVPENEDADFDAHWGSS